MVSGPKTQFMDFAFEQNDYGIGEPVKILGEELKELLVSYTSGDY